MYRSASFLVSARRHRHSGLAEIREPLIFLKGSGSRELAGNEPGSVTGQSAPSSSTRAAATAFVSAEAVAVAVAIAGTAPAIASAATAGTTTARRRRPELMITGLSFLAG